MKLPKLFAEGLRLVVLLALLVGGISAGRADDTQKAFTLDCKIEGRKGEAITELVVCGVRQAGDFSGAILLRAPAKPDPNWDEIIAPASLRAVRGDVIYLRIRCSRLPQMHRDEYSGSFVRTSGLKASAWEELGVTDVQTISQNEFLGVPAK